jgi:hypothetical protein
MNSLSGVSMKKMIVHKSVAERSVHHFVGNQLQNQFIVSDQHGLFDKILDVQQLIGCHSQGYRALCPTVLVL